MTSKKIFDVEDVTGKESVHAILETTAAEALLEAPDRIAARQVEINAEKAREAAEQAAVVAKMLGKHYTGEPSTAVDQFRGDASRTTDAAVAEGKHDVEEAKAVGAGYVEQAKVLATSAIETAQTYLPTAVGGKPAEPQPTTARTMLETSTDQSGEGLVSQIQTAATDAYTTVVETAQPHLEKAKGVAQAAVDKAQPHVEKAKATAQGYMGTAGTQGAQVADTHGPVTPASSTGIPATNAPLESGPDTTKTPYPKT